MVDVDRIEQKIDRMELSTTPIDMKLGGVQFQSMLELMEFAKLMAVSGSAVPIHLRGNPGGCLAICTKALRFGFDPFALAEHSFAMSKSTKVDGQWQDIETIAYDSFVIAAIIEAHAPIEGRMRIVYEGEGDERKCTVSAMPKGEKEPLTLTSPSLGTLKANRGTNDKGVLKGSPLYITDPDQQLAYFTRRNFCRRHFPEVLLGWYTREEMEAEGFDKAKDITPKDDTPPIAKRLKGSKGKAGFKATNVDDATKQPEDMSAADAFEQGRQDHEDKKPFTVNAAWSEANQDAYKSGWQSMEEPQPQAVMG